MRCKAIKSAPGSINGLLFEPRADWRPPSAFPNLSGIKSVGFDIETRDPNLKAKGPGFIRGDAEVVGFSFAAGNDAWYFPFGHLSGGNLDRDVCLRFLRDQFHDDSRFIVGANLQYELEGLHSLGITNPKGRFLDVQVAEAIIDEERDAGYDLGTLSERWLGVAKDEKLLREAADAYGVDPKGGLWKLHSKYVGAYGEFDARAALAIFGKQLEILKREDLTSIFELESRLLPILWRMRLQGIPVDLDRARGLSGDLKTKEDQLRNELNGILGYHIDEWSGADLLKLCEKQKILYPRTEKGNPSFVKAFLEESDEPLLQKVQAIREINRLRQTFVDDWIFKNELNGWIHPQWVQLVAEDGGGARTGRMAAKNPNPQQVPSRSELAHLVRRCFRRHDGGLWGKLDYSQQEPRILTHYAYLRKFAGAAEIREAYIKDPKMRIYGVLSQMAGISDGQSKDLTLGRMYGMGIKKMAQKLNCSLEKAKDILGRFDRGVPFVKEIAEDAARQASRRGWIKTLCGRKRHFNYWEPVNVFELKEKAEECVRAGNPVPPEYDTRPVGSKELAEAKWPRYQHRRAWTHKALNALVQGSGADMAKTAMVHGYEQQKRLPYMQVHDELDGPVDSQSDGEAWQHLAENCVELTVPIKAGLYVGESWK